MLPAPEPVSLLPVEWRIVRVDGLPAFALSAHGYENLSRNMADILRWMREADHQLNHYRSTLSRED